VAHLSLLKEGDEMKRLGKKNLKEEKKR